MKEIEIGTTFTVEEEVTIEKSAGQVGSGLLDVYSTPAMIALMGALRMEGISNTLHTVTGAKQNVIAGAIHAGL